MSEFHATAAGAVPQVRVGLTPSEEGSGGCDAPKLASGGMLQDHLPTLSTAIASKASNSTRRGVHASHPRGEGGVVM